LRRAVGNAGILLSGKASAGLMQLATFALAARGLGIESFGYFSMLVAQVLLLTGLATFESNQAIVRYGVDHLATDNARAFQSLIKAGTLLDLGAATAAALAAFVLPPLIGPALGWNGEIIALAQMIAPLAFANAIATPKGMLRLFGRFGLLTAHSVVTPAARLAGFFVAWMTSAELGTYLLIWLAAGWLGAITAFILAWGEARRRNLLAGMTSSLRGLSAANPGVWRFTLYSNLHSSVALIPLQGATFIVGALISAEAAGLFRIAREMGTALAKPIDLINQALFPDLSRLVRAGEWSRLLRAAVGGGLLAGLIGLAVAGVSLLIGGPLIHLLFGPEFAPAAPLFTVIALATGLRVFAFAADPILYALHKPQASLLIAIVTSLLFFTILWWRADDGLMASGEAFLVMNVTGALLSALVAWSAVSRSRRRGADEQTSPDAAQER
jgi:O-antigen/teichoic acid export membrane protein